MLRPLAGLLKGLASRGRLRIATVGPRTASETRRLLGVGPSLTPGSFTGADLARQLAALRPRCVAAARSEKASPGLRRVLEESGVSLVEVPLYTLRVVEEMARAAARIADLFDYVAFTSPSGVEAFAAHYAGSPRFTPAAIGPTTASRIREAGLGDPLVPSRYTLDGLAEAISRDWEQRGRRG
jgi:uroporphyrinogen-III synthase